MIELLNIIGQDSALTQLQRYMGVKRLPHALLFAGPDGVGRRTTAIALAKTLLCGQCETTTNSGRFADLDESAPLAQACGECKDCKTIEAGTHPDLQIIYKELARYHEDSNVRNSVMQELGIPVIRSFLIAPSSKTPSRGRGKVFIVLESELMSAAAQNALLKTLEEPPPNVTIILICQKPDRMLPTTLSRCAMVRFGPLPRNFVTDKLIEASLPGDQAGFWAAFTDGSIGRATEMAGQGMYEIKRDLLDRLAGLDAGGDCELSEHLSALTDKLAIEAVNEAKKDDANLSKNLASRRAVAAMLELIASAYRDALTVACGADRELIHMDQPAAIDAIARRFDVIELATIIEQLSEFERLLWRNVNPKIVWDNVVITCAAALPLEL